MSLRTLDEQHLLRGNTPQENDTNTTFEPMHTSGSPLNLISRTETENLRRIATNQSNKSRRRSSVYNPPSNNAIQETRGSESSRELEPELDPTSPDFNLEQWLKAVVADFELRGQSGVRGGILFQHLNVSGSGSALQLQGTVGGMLSAPFRIPELLRQRRSPSRRILNDFNGVMKSGELLLVLGRPGAGCSTLLKTLCGETNGLDIESSSVLHYNGMLLI
jgi:ABC-type multidrug transport system fused ATPase/permease subunit